LILASKVNKIKGMIKMKKAVFILETLTCPTCVPQIENTLEKVEGVEGIKIMFYSERVRILFDPEVVHVSEIKESIEKIGYPVLSKRVG